MNYDFMVNNNFFYLLINNKKEKYYNGIYLSPEELYFLSNFEAKP